MDPDFVNAIKANPTKFAEVVQAGRSGRKQTLLVDGTDQHSGKGYLSGEPLPNDLSENLMKNMEEYRRVLKNAKKGKTTTTHLSFNLLKPEIRAQMHDADEFCDKRYIAIIRRG